MSESITEEQASDRSYKQIYIGPKKVPIPDDWGTANLSDIAQAGKKTFVDGDWVESEDMVQDGAYQLIQLGNIGKGHFKGECDKYVSEEFFQEENCTLVEEGDLLISRLADPVLRTIIVPEFEKKSITAVDIVVAKVDETEWSKEYICQLLNSKPLADAGNSLATGSTRQRISRSNMSKITIPRPPLPEQRRIADILSTVDEQIQQTDKTIEKTKELKNGLRQDLITKGIGHNDFKEFHIGPFEYTIPQSWGVTTVAECAKNRDSERIPVKSSKREDMDGEIPYYGASGCIDYVDDYLFDGTFLLIAEDGKNLLRRTRPIAFKITGKSWVNNHAHILKPNEDMALEYLLNYFEMLKYDPFVTGMDQIKLNQTNLNQIKVPKPSLEEQERIAEVLRSVTQKIEQGKSRLEKLEQLKRGLMQDLLTGKVRVNAD